jgi:hypothetical protein
MNGMLNVRTDVTYIDTPAHLRQVVADIDRIAAKSGVPVHYFAHTQDIDCKCGATHGSMYVHPDYNGSSTKQIAPGLEIAIPAQRPAICLVYNVDKIAADRLFWSFGHELGHHMQVRRGDADRSTPQTLMHTERNAWEYAQALGNVCGYPLNDAIAKERDMALAGYEDFALNWALSDLLARHF